MSRCRFCAPTGRTWPAGRLGVLAAALALAGCIGGGVRGPEWVRLHKASAYPDGQWLVGVGRGKNPTLAENVARSELSKPIEVQIKSEVSAVTAESTSTVGGKTGYRSHQSVTDRLVARTNIKLQGVEIVDRWHDTGSNVYYALAVLNRKEAVAGLGEEASSLAEAANELLAHARAKAAAGDRPAALSAYHRAMVKAVRHGILAARLRVVGKRPYLGESPRMTPIQIELAFRRLAEEMRIAVVVFGEYPGHDEKPCALAETRIVKALTREGLIAAAIGDEVRSVGHAGLTGDLSRTRDALSGRASYVVIGKVKVVFQGQVKRLSAHAYQAEGSGVFIDLGTGRIIANVSFPGGVDTRRISLDHGAAARGAHDEAASTLAKKLSLAVKEALLGK